jgi:hypothetical protein
MLRMWLEELESLEAISRDDLTRDLFLRMAAMSQAGRLEPFLSELEDDQELDDATKGTLAEIAEDPSFLLMVEDYVQKTKILH